MPNGTRVRLHFNENPYGVVPEVRERIVQELGEVDLGRYPDGEAKRLCSALANYAGVNPENIVVGNGSDELLQLILLSFLPELERVVIPVPTFGMYRKGAELAGLEVVEIPLLEAFELDVPGILRELSRAPSALFLCAPNNPTGNYFSEEDVGSLWDSAARVIVMDEAYYEFGGRSHVAATERDPRIIVTRTLSKAFGLAAMRVGYLIAHTASVCKLQNCRQPYNTSAAAQVAARVVVEEAQVQLATVAEMARLRQWLIRHLGDIEGLSPLPSEGNFVLVRVEENVLGHGARDLHARLEHEGIAIRYFSEGARLGNHVRVSVGTADECRRLVDRVSCWARGGN